MIGNVTNLLLAQMLLSSHRPHSGNWPQTGQIDSGLAESGNVHMPGEALPGVELQQRWSEEDRWPTDDEFLPRLLREQQRRLEEQRRRLYHERLERLRGPMEEDRQLWPERREREREDRLRRGESMIG